MTNQVYVQDADNELVQELMNRPDVARIEEEGIVYLDEPVIYDRQTNHPLANQWGVVAIQAPEVWGMPAGNTGEGVTVGIIDSGALASHEILRSNYRNDGYSWFDTLEGSAEPRDDRGHGSSWDHRVDQRLRSCAWC